MKGEIYLDEKKIRFPEASCMVPYTE